MTIRLAQQTDVAAIAHIHVQSWYWAFDGLMPDDYIKGFTEQKRQAEWQTILDNQTETVWVATIGQQVVGFLSYPAPQNNKLLLNKLYLLPQYAGLGLGQKLMAKFDAIAKDLAVSHLQLYVLDNNEKAIRFYQKHGFAFASGQLEEEFNGQLIIDKLMEKPLSP
ncbi:GNAT family N-acetyltransferase [Catenovulum sp. SM1970]|uniref:GNAT family N-acetyltransferase n=1 Tax=Marinifaba aquimaris TaxID=2741323 RepID=UPI0015736269|nr:GNAT family N-acetyltransferase [Marinifaba aquimaris]NTS76788.1 GNAT family N-acetyltransferase [Marinifaba aquimaris]